MTDVKSLGVVLLKSIGAGHRALNRAGKFQDLEIIEFAPLGSHAQILVCGDRKRVQSFVTGTRSNDLERSITIPHFSETILRHYLSLDSADIQDFVVVVESSFIGDLFQVASQALEKKLGVVDLRLFRSENHPGHLILTGTKSEVSSDWLADLRRLPCRVTVVPELSEGYKKFMGPDYCGSPQSSE